MNKDDSTILDFRTRIRAWPSNRLFSSPRGGRILAILVFGVWGAALGQRTADEINTIDVFKRSAPAVVHVKSIHLTEHDDKSELDEGTGSGFLIDQAGYVLTNYHVVENSIEVKLMLDGQAFGAILVGTAPAFDVALLKLQASEPALSRLAPLPLGDSGSIEIGQKVLAIGNSLGFHNTLSTGVVSGLFRDLPGAPVGLGEAFLQTDAPINPGNSGGPLLDSAGKVVGINTAIAKEGQNIGFAIPIDFVKKILPDLMKMGHVYKPNLGFSAIPVSPALASLLGLPAKSGLLVQEVLEGGPSYQAGLKGGSRMIPINSSTVYVLGGDLIVALNGKEVRSPQDLTVLLLSSHPGDRIQLEVLRSEDRHKISVMLPPMHF